VFGQNRLCLFLKRFHVQSVFCLSLSVVLSRLQLVRYSLLVSDLGLAFLFLQLLLLLDSSLPSAFLCTDLSLQTLLNPLLLLLSDLFALRALLLLFKARLLFCRALFLPLLEVLFGLSTFCLPFCFELLRACLLLLLTSFRQLLLLLFLFLALRLSLCRDLS
jgi:hypothetical protein